CSLPRTLYLTCTIPPKRVKDQIAQEQIGELLTHIDHHRRDNDGPPRLGHPPAAACPRHGNPTPRTLPRPRRPLPSRARRGRQARGLSGAYQLASHRPVRGDDDPPLDTTCSRPPRAACL